LQVLNLLTFTQTLVTFSQYGSVVNKDILILLVENEAIAFGIVEPLYYS
jgi:hypothetical protein